MLKIAIATFSGLMVFVAPASALEAQGHPTPIRDVSVAAGINLAAPTYALYGVRYRHSVTELVSIQAAYERGQYDLLVSGNLQNLAVTRLHGSVLLNTPLYAGLGLTHHSDINSPSGLFSVPSNDFWFDGILGVRFPLGRISLGAEYRHALAQAPSTLGLTAGMSF